MYQAIMVPRTVIITPMNIFLIIGCAVGVAVFVVLFWDEEFKN